MHTYYSLKTFLQRLLQQDSRLYAALLSLLLSVTTLLRGEPINLDGMLYLHAANTYLQEGVRASMHVYPWPFYQLLIAWLHQLTHLPLPLAAHSLDAILHALLIVAFISLIKELGGDTRVQWVSAFIILIYPALNHDRALLVRDFGYWCLALTSLCLLIRYSRTLQWRYAISWALFMAVASLFRLEGIILLLGLPLALLWPTGKPITTQLSIFLRAYSLILLAAVATCLWLLTHPGLPSSYLGRLPELCQQVQQALSASITNINLKSQLFAQTALSELAQENARPILLGGLFSLLVLQCLSVLNPLFALLGIYGMYHRTLALTPSTRHILILGLLLNFAMLVVFISQQFFLSPRYLIFPCLILLIWVPFSLVKLYQNYQEKLTSRWLMRVLILLLAVMAIGSIHHFGPSKNYLVKAGQWLQQNTTVQSTVCSNSLEVLFAARQMANSWQVPAVKQVHALTLTPGCGKADYIAWRINDSEQIPTNLANLPQPIADFHNRRGDKVLIFKSAAKAA